MSQTKIDRAYFEKNLPVPDEAFVKQSMDRFKARAEHPSRPRLKMALILGILLALLLAAALAAGLLYSQRFEFIRSARQAVMAEYGLSQDELSLFQEHVMEDSGGMTVIYSPSIDALAHMGSYKAILKPGQPPQTSRSGSVAVFAPQSTPAPDAPYSSPYGTPGKDDMPYEQALALAYQAVEWEYGLTGQDIEAGETTTHFITQGPENPKWFFWFFPGGAAAGESFSVTMDAKDGTILYVIKDAPGNG